MKAFLVVSAFVLAFAGVVAFEGATSKDREGFWGGVARMIDIIVQAILS